jgi:hypothetical protein
VPGGTSVSRVSYPSGQVTTVTTSRYTPYFRCSGGRFAGELDEPAQRRAGNDGENVDVRRWPRKAVKNGDDEPTQTVRFDGAMKPRIRVAKEAAPRLSPEVTPREGSTRARLQVPLESPGVPRVSELDGGQNLPGAVPCRVRREPRVVGGQPIDDARREADVVLLGVAQTLEQVDDARLVRHAGRPARTSPERGRAISRVVRLVAERKIDGMCDGRWRRIGQSLRRDE